MFHFLLFPLPNWCGFLKGFSPPLLERYGSNPPLKCLIPLVSGKNRGLEGLAAAILKLWDQTEVRNPLS